MAVAVTLYETEIGVLLSLPEEQRGRILTAILCDTTGKELPEMDASDNAIFTLVNAQVKRAAELSNKRKQSAKTRWQNQASDDSDDTQEQQSDTTPMQIDNADMQNDTSVMQNQANESNGDTNLCTNTNTNTITKTNTNTKTETSTKTENAPTLASSDGTKTKKPKKPLEKKKSYAEYVTLTEEEYSKLVNQYGEEATQWCIWKLDNYKGSNGKKYASDYRAILSWVIGTYQEEQAKRKQPAAQSKPPGSINTGNPFLDMIRDLEEQEAKEIVVQGNVADNGNT